MSHDPAIAPPGTSSRPYRPRDISPIPCEEDLRPDSHLYDRLQSGEVVDPDYGPAPCGAWVHNDDIAEHIDADCEDCADIERVTA